MKYFNAIRDNNGISMETLKQSFPSLFAKRASPKVSDRYLFLSTASILETVKDRFMVVEARQRSVRLDGRDPRFTRHQVRLRARDVKPIINGVYPELLFTNSHDGQSRGALFGGLFRLICLNGLVISCGPSSGFSLRHVQSSKDMFSKFDEVLEVTQSAGDSVNKMSAKKLSRPKQVAFAKAAAEVAYEAPDFDTSLLLQPRRVEDEGDDVWSVMNRVQENIIRGGVSIPASGDRTRPATLRGITHIGRDTAINQALWSLAEAAV